MSTVDLVMEEAWSWQEDFFGGGEGLPQCVEDGQGWLRLAWCDGQHIRRVVGGNEFNDRLER
jgi:hypothetical protein